MSEPSEFEARLKAVEKELAELKVLVRRGGRAPLVQAFARLDGRLSRIRGGCSVGSRTAQCDKGSL